MTGPKTVTAAWGILFAAVILFAAWVRITNPAPTVRTPDERYYIYYAGKVTEQPFEAPRELVLEYNTHPGNWIYPMPLRIAYYYSIALIMKLWHVPPEQAGAALSTAASIVQLLIVTLLGLRFFDRWTVLVAVCLLSVSPQDLAMARRVWTDGVIGCAGIILVWICAEISVRPRARAWFAALWIWSVYFLLLKETGGFFFGFCILWVAVESWRQHQSWKRVAWILTGAVVTALFSFLLMALLCGGVPAALMTARHTAQTLPTNPYVTFSQTGPWYSFPLGFWILSPLSAFACAAGILALLLKLNSLGDVLSFDQRQRCIAAGLSALIVLVVVMATWPTGLMNLRYMSFIAGPSCLMASLGLSYIIARIKSRLGPRVSLPVSAAAALIITFSCWCDYARYRDLFVQRAIPDLDIRNVITSPL